MEELPLCNRLIRGTHAVLMAGVRGQEKSPGEFRHSQNLLGGYGSTLKTARYIPPNVPHMVLSLSDLEKYINAGDDLDILIRSGIIYYRFETIHPILDGKGRVGRMLITLFLIEKGLVKNPISYISYFYAPLTPLLFHKINNFASSFSIKKGLFLGLYSDYLFCYQSFMVLITKYGVVRRFLPT